MSSRDNPTLIQGALQLIEVLLTKLPQVYRSSFRREGVLYEVETLAGEDLTSVKTAKQAAGAIVKTEEDDTGSVPKVTASQTTTSTSALSISNTSLMSNANNQSPTKIAALSDPQDLNIVRARILKAKTTTASPSEKAGEDEADKALDKMKSLVKMMVEEDAEVPVLKGAVTELAGLFGSEKNSVSSFELLKSGLVDGLLECAIIDGKGKRPFPSCFTPTPFVLTKPVLC